MFLHLDAASQPLSALRYRRQFTNNERKVITQPFAFNKYFDVMRNPTKHLVVAFSIFPKARVLAFTSPSVHTRALSVRIHRNNHLKRQQRFSTSISSVADGDAVSTPTSSYIQVHRALLISSFTDGVQKSKKAQEFLRSSLLSCMMQQEVLRLEQTVAQSALSSPCNGPDPVALQALEVADQQLSLLDKSTNSSPMLTMDKYNNILTDSGGILRFVYIPTALYALRSDSTNTPGKQRQRARADGKQRRSEIVATLSEILFVQEDQENQIRIHSVTLDLDDGSIKHPEGSKQPNDFPKTGKEALRNWNPHFVYVEGGNTFWLYHCMEKGGWRSDLMDLIATKPREMTDTRDDEENALPSTTAATVYCGKSAGAILAGAKIETATWKGWDDPSVVPGRESYDAWRGISGLDLLGGASIFPHMTEQWESLVTEKTVGFDSHVYCISDSQMCLVDGEQQTIFTIQSDDVQ